ncbi:MAG TPA: AAA family ATPase [Geminocystis sp. M7585_C2015_104]|nr:AAA family ATPase [Geminocystis sp. M7585_C2015_104]
MTELNENYSQKVVFPADEYYKPIPDNIILNIGDRRRAKQIREILKNLYGVLKPLHVYIKFVFLTGESKFSKVSILSGLNQLNHITPDKAYFTICGCT